MENKWPEKKELTYKQDWNGELNSEKLGWNQCHDAFMKIINEKTKLDTNAVANFFVQELGLYEYEAYDSAVIFCSKFGTKKGQHERD